MQERRSRNSAKIIVVNAQMVFQVQLVVTKNAFRLIVYLDLFLFCFIVFSHLLKVSDNSTTSMRGKNVSFSWKLAIKLITDKCCDLLFCCHHDHWNHHIHSHHDLYKNHHYCHHQCYHYHHHQHSRGNLSTILSLHIIAFTIVFPPSPHHRVVGIY